jgi:hypothetical protein
MNWLKRLFDGKAKTETVKIKPSDRVSDSSTERVTAYLKSEEEKRLINRLENINSSKTEKLNTAIFLASLLTSDSMKALWESMDNDDVDIRNRCAISLGTILLKRLIDEQPKIMEEIRQADPDMKLMLFMISCEKLISINIFNNRELSFAQSDKVSTIVKLLMRNLS